MPFRRSGFVDPLRSRSVLTFHRAQYREVQTNTNSITTAISRLFLYVILFPVQYCCFVKVIEVYRCECLFYSHVSWEIGGELRNWAWSMEKVNVEILPLRNLDSPKSWLSRPCNNSPFSHTHIITCYTIFCFRYFVIVFIHVLEALVAWKLSR
jgi:hypothetical protein